MAKIILVATRNFKEVEWKAFEEELGQRLEGIRKDRITRWEEVEEWLGVVIETL